MPLSSTCFNCGAAKMPSNYADIYCPECTAAKEAAEKEAPEGASMSDRIRAGKTALSHRAVHAHKNHVDPRNFDQSMRHGQ